MCVGYILTIILDELPNVFLNVIIKNPAACFFECVQYAV